ncbi:phosphodiesterase [Pseudazoarcus pumilus]|uniref:Phosphodiesterase n=1 Tax=Pseudazoarcus pumilus TaxID=2067960 RepID=A0A2I6S7E1_9RHOO|nr:phosphodiesterase [Pseudazoarcus pumilus]AUN95177.1 phosphodiesterase [Pseudazoarcus pumilus]
MLIAQISDTHIGVPGALAYGRVDVSRMLIDCVRHVCRLDPRPDLLLVTGDLVDRGIPDEYAHFRELLAPLQMPVRVIAGNHDEREALREAFIGDGYLPSSGFLHYVLDEYPLRVIGLDTLVPGSGRGELCAERLEWLDATLSAKPHAPTLVALHHPPFDTGIAYMDRLGLTGREAYADLIEAHPQVRATLCGHLHRHIVSAIGNRPAITAPSPAHQVALNFDADAPGCFSMEPPGFLLHRWDGKHLTSHAVSIGNFAGPYPFRR